METQLANNKSFWLLVFALFTSRVFVQAQPVADQNQIYNAVSGTNSEPVLYSDVNITTFELLTGNLQFSKDNSLQKAVIAPFKLIFSQKDLLPKDKSKKAALKAYLLDALTQTRFNIAQKENVTTFGLGLGYDWGSPFSPRGNSKFINAFSGAPALPVGPVGETPDEFNLRKEQFFDNNIAPLYSDYYNDLQTAVKLNAGYNISFFEVIGGDKVDKDKDGVTDNEHKVKGKDATLGIGYSFQGVAAISLNGHWGESYSSPKGTEKKVPYWGVSGSLACRIAVLKRDYKTSEDYLKSLFIPSLILGTAIEYQKVTDNETYAKDGITEAFVATPFLDFKISPKVQFRVGVPIKKFSGIQKEIAFGPFIQYSLQLANKE